MRVLTEGELFNLRTWASKQPPEVGDLIAKAVAELMALRERESATRFLMGIEGEV